MENRRIRVYVVCFVAWLCFYTVPAALAAKSAEESFLWLSDIHFDPLSDKALTDQLAAAEIAQWPSIFANSSPHLSSFGQDTNWPLLASALDAIRKTAPDAAFTVVTGDLLPHHFRERFDQSASVHDDAAFRDFVRKTTQFVALQLKSIAPSKPVFLTLGNNDSNCGDYQLQPDGSFLQDTLPVVADLLQKPASELKEWTKNGGYSVPHPTLHKVRIVAIDTIFLSARYRNFCGNAFSADPSKDLMQWLEGELSKAQQKHEKVWLIYHIPPGIDGFATTRHDNKAVPLWKAEYTEEFNRLLSLYHNEIIVSLAGHTHLDDFRLVNSSAKSRSLVLMIPSLGPNVGQNPVFRTVSFQNSGKLTDQATYFLSNLAAANKETKPEWKLEYRFSQEWGMKQLNYKNFSNLYRGIDQSPETRTRWKFLYSVSRPESNTITDKSFWALHCASGNTNATPYQECLNSHK